jgi:hypothetical protein
VRLAPLAPQLLLQLALWRRDILLQRALLLRQALNLTQIQITKKRAFVSSFVNDEQVELTMNFHAKADTNERTGKTRQAMPAREDGYRWRVSSAHLVA